VPTRKTDWGSKQWLTDENASQFKTKNKDDFMQGLTLSGLGIWNVDQIYKMDSFLAINAAYKNQKGKTVRAEQVTLINLDVNGAISYDPQRPAYSPSARNVMMLFTKSGKKYIYREPAFKRLFLKNGDSHTFEMENITHKVKHVEDLRVELGLKKG